MTQTPLSPSVPPEIEDAAKQLANEALLMAVIKRLAQGTPAIAQEIFDDAIRRLPTPKYANEPSAPDAAKGILQQRAAAAISEIEPPRQLDGGGFQREVKRG